MGIIFWTSLSLLIYTYFGYLILLFLFSKLKSNPATKSNFVPKVSFLIAAYNEEKAIEQKILNTLDLNYPKEKIEIIVASDGSTDKTNDIVAKFIEKGVKLIANSKQRGKTYAQTDAVSKANGEIIIFSDATTDYDKHAIKYLVQPFADENVGCVAGRLRFKNLHEEINAEKKYEKNIYMIYEELVKHKESEIWSTLGVNGCIFAMRKSLYTPLPPGVIDDFGLPLKTIEKGFRVIYESRAIGYEEPPTSFSMEFQRKIRTTILGLTGFITMKTLLNPFKFGLISIQMISHKFLRWVGSFLLIFLLISNFFLINISFLYWLSFHIQIAFYGLALLNIVTKRKIKNKFLTIPYYFIMINLSAFIGVIKFVMGNRNIMWKTVR